MKCNCFLSPHVHCVKSLNLLTTCCHLLFPIYLSSPTSYWWPFYCALDSNVTWRGCGNRRWATRACCMFDVSTLTHKRLDTLVTMGSACIDTRKVQQSFWYTECRIQACLIFHIGDFNMTLFHNLPCFTRSLCQPYTPAHY